METNACTGSICVESLELQLLKDRNVANEVAAMEANGILFHMSVK